jgi:hypothetical protein
MAGASPTAIFAAKAPGIMRSLMADFTLDVESAAAVLGNLGHESGGFRFLQEKKPLVPGSAGGYGWAQWTGPRRRSYEAYCKRTGLDPAGDKANYGFLFVELSGSEKSAIVAVKAAKGLRAKVIAFESHFERAGVKHYDSRLVWAQRALDAYGSKRSQETSVPANTTPSPPGLPVRPVPAPPAVQVPPRPQSLWAAILGLFTRKAVK